MDRVILHSDLNCFYASVEMALHPELRDRAVAVCGSTELRHGIVLAKSEKAKRCGVKTGMINSEAVRLCPELIMVRPEYDQYMKYSGLVRKIYSRYTDMIEPFGMDECWLDVTGSTKIFGTGREIADTIRETVKKELGLTVSVGVSFNKIFAKLGSDMKKPDAVTEISRENFKAKIYNLPVSDMLCVGRRTAATLLKYGIKTIGELADTPKKFLEGQFGVNGGMLWDFANGLDNSPVMQEDFYEPVKSVGHGVTCVSDLLTDEEVKGVILELSQDVGHRLKKYGLKAAGVQVSVRDSGLLTENYTGKLTPTDCTMLIAEGAFKSFSENYKWEKNVRAITVRAINLVEKDVEVQTDFFNDVKKQQKTEKVDELVDSIREKYGRGAIYNALLMKNTKIPWGYTGKALQVLPGSMYKQGIK